MKKFMIAMAVAAMTISGFTASAQNTKTDTDCCAPCPNKTENCRQPENCAKKSQCPFNGLNLTDAQKNKLKELHKAEAAKRQECKQAKQGCSRTMRTEHLAAVKAILTPEQYVSYLENIAVSGHGSWKNRASTTVQCAPPALRLQTQHAPRLPHPNNQNDLIPI